MALLRKQSIELSSKLNIIDKPLTIEQPSKRILLILLAALVGFVCVLMVLVVMEVSDQTIKTLERGIEKTGLHALGAFPYFDKKTEDLSQVLTGQIVTNLKLKINAKSLTNQTPLVLVCSTQPYEGKTYIANAVSDFLRASKANVLQITPTESDKTYFEDGRLFYPQDRPLTEIKKISELISQWIDPNEYDYCFFELPSLLSGNVPTHLLKNASMTLLTVSAGRSWKKADKQAIAIFQNFHLPVETVINGVMNNSIESLVSEAHLKTPKWKTFLKRLLGLEFHNKNLKFA